MAYEICMVKLISGEMVIGKHDSEQKAITDPAVLQTMPTQQGVQMMLLPYGYPFEQEFTGSISDSHVIYTYPKCPEELKDKYLEAVSNLTLSSGGLGGLNLKSPGSGGDISSLLRGK